MPFHIHIEFAVEPPKPAKLSPDEDTERLLRRIQAAGPALVDLYKQAVGPALTDLYKATMTSADADLSPPPRMRSGAASDCDGPLRDAYHTIFGVAPLPPEILSVLSSLLNREPPPEDDPDSDPDDEDGYSET